MPRRNRQKLHKELRLRAEAHQSELRDRRRRQSELAAATRRLAEAALRGALPATGGRFVRTSTHADQVVAQIRDLLRLAHVAAPLQRRVEQLVRAVEARVPALATVDQLPWFTLLARQEWVRAPGDWPGEGGSARRQRDSFARHLLTRYPVPVFLLRALDVEPIAIARVPVEDEWAVGLLARIGRGVSVRSLVGTEVLPVPLTRRMAHAFLTATASTEPIVALRQAQVLGLGGGKRLVQALLGTRLGRLHGPDDKVGEPFWHGVLAWLCAREPLHALTSARLDQVLAWVEAGQREALAEGRSWSLKGRTADSVLRDAEELALRRARIRHDAFPATGLLPLRHEGWSVEAIDDDAALSAEGAAMSHCAFSYRNLIRKGKVSLWSLRHEGTRRATVEVALGAGRVVQAKRARNESCSAEELHIVGRWASLNRLGLRLKP